MSDHITDEMVAAVRGYITYVLNDGLEDVGDGNATDIIAVALAAAPTVEGWVVCDSDFHHHKVVPEHHMRDTGRMRRDTSICDGTYATHRALILGPTVEVSP